MPTKKGPTDVSSHIGDKAHFMGTVTFLSKQMALFHFELFLIIENPELFMG